MAIINVTHPTGSYPIYLDKGILTHAGQYLAELGYKGRCAVVTNTTVGPLHAETLLTSLREAGFDPTRIDLPDGEQFKTLATIAGLYGKLVAAKLDRRSLVIALGGGVIGDMAGFAAATYLRGVPFVQIPTTLLAMVDSSVGGKTGVDLSEGKNLVGAFKQPELVIIDPDVLATLPDVEFRAGLAETIKNAVIGAPHLFAAIERGQYDLTWLVAEAVGVKVRVVQADPFEQGQRAVLNLGHTFGHAFEKLSNFEMRHGEAVARGMACAARLAARLGYCAGDTAEFIIALLAQVGLPFGPLPYPAAEVWAAMSTDKKRQGNTLRFILPRAIGDVAIFDNIAEMDVKAILETP